MIVENAEYRHFLPTGRRPARRTRSLEHDVFRREGGCCAVAEPC